MNNELIPNNVKRKLVFIPHHQLKMFLSCGQLIAEYSYHVVS